MKSSPRFTRAGVPREPRGRIVASEFRTKLLSRRTNPEEYRVYRAGLEWDLTDPIVIDTPDDFNSKQRWRDKLTPYHHQVTNLITFCRRLPVTLLADDVGFGKTISAGLIASELISRSRVSKIPIVCPKLLGPQWKEEANLRDQKQIRARNRASFYSR
jgi:SNF2 family DNA or RNA helicase